MKTKQTSAKRLRLAILITMTCLYLSVASASCGLMMTSTNQVGINAKNYYSVTVDDNNTKWFLTELGIVSFDGENWRLLPNSAIQGKEFRDIVFDATDEDTGFWIATSAGITSFKSLTKDEDAVSFTTENSTLVSNDGQKVAIGANGMKWFASDQGVTAYVDGKWLKPTYDDLYPAMIFEAFPITAIVSSPTGDTLMVATDGAGVARIARNRYNVDALTGASEYAIWGPINLPSDNIQSAHVTRTGEKWFGTDLGIARHIGDDTLDKWTVWTTEEGLVHNFVQSITSDQDGNVWFGTQGGLSVFDGTKFTNYTKADGLSSDNILCLTVDKNGVVWIGTDEGVNSFSNGTLTSY